MTYQPDDEKPSYVIHGTISDSAGKGIPHAEVLVSWQRIRSRVQLASGHTSEDGSYRLRYEVPGDAQGKVLVVVEARSPKLAKPLESELTAAVPDLQVD